MNILKRFQYITSSILLAAIITACVNSSSKPRLEELHIYEGRYKYLNNSSLDIVTSAMDTTLYAVIDGAKYPLHHLNGDTFMDMQDNLVVFSRDHTYLPSSFSVGGQSFELLTRDFERIEMIPRKVLFQHPEQYAYLPPMQHSDGLATGELGHAFSDPAPIIEMVKQTIAGNYPDVHSILIYRHGKLVLEEYFYGYDQNTPHQLRSATKPFISALVGITVERGHIKSVTDPLLPYFSEKYDTIANMDSRKRDMTIEQFLMYRHGLDCQNNDPESLGNEQAMMASDDWIKYTLDLPIETDPGQKSSYCTGCALTLGSLVEEATGEEIESFAYTYLFEPMGIKNYKWTFEPNPASTNTFSQMYLTSRDLIKLAAMYLNEGMWNGQSILPAAWVRKTFDTETGDYGYLWEHKFFEKNSTHYNSFLASGNGGQKINIWPELDMITVFTGGNYNSYALYGKSTPPNEMIPKFILSSIE